MVERIVEFFEPYMAQYGYAIVALATLLENSIAAGLVVPGETLLLAASFYAARGDLDPVVVATVASVGALVGDNVGYLIGRTFGRGFLERRAGWFLLSRERLAKADAYYRGHGGKTVFLGRFVPVLRSLVCLLAGVGRMRYGRFLAFDAAGAILWAVGHTALGYLAGRSYEELDARLGQAGVLALLLLLALIAFSLWRRRRAVERAAVRRADAEQPEAEEMP